MSSQNSSNDLPKRLWAAENDSAYDYLSNHKSQCLMRLLALYRSQIIDAVELFVGKDPMWPKLRSRLLTLLGDRGLEGAVREEMCRRYTELFSKNGGDQ